MKGKREWEWRLEQCPFSASLSPHDQFCASCPPSVDTPSVESGYPSRHFHFHHMVFPGCSIHNTIIQLNFVPCVPLIPSSQLQRKLKQLYKWQDADHILFLVEVNSIIKKAPTTNSTMCRRMVIGRYFLGMLAKLVLHQPPDRLLCH